MINEIKKNKLSNFQLLFLSPHSDATNSLRSNYLFGHSSLLGDIPYYPNISINGDLYKKIISGEKFYLFIFDDDLARLANFNSLIHDNFNGSYQIYSHGDFSSKYLFNYKILLFN